MDRRLTHNEAKEILLNDGKVDGYFLSGSYNCNPIEFNKHKLRIEDCEGDWIDLYGLDYFTEHKELIKFEYWINIYDDGFAEISTTRKDADKVAGPDRIACLKISGKEGDGLKNE